MGLVSVLPSVGAKGFTGVLMILFALMDAVVAELTLVHEGSGIVERSRWGYTLLPSTFPLTWDEARAACEAIPGSMLARVEGWEAEAALKEYLMALKVENPVWLANRQSLPEVLEDEQREMNHVGSMLEPGINGPTDGRAGVMNIMSGDLSVGGDVGVTLRCAIYTVGVGIVHELCSTRTVSAALCVQRLSSDRPLSTMCPSSVHRAWLLIARSTETTTLQETEETTVSIMALQQCHHRLTLGHTTCHPQTGWSQLVCPPESQPGKHHRASKKTHRGHHHLGRGHLRLSRKVNKFPKTNDVTSREERSNNNERNKRSAIDFEDERAEMIWESRSPHPRLAPLAKAESLNMDWIESIMKDMKNENKKIDSSKKDKSSHGQNTQNNLPEGEEKEGTTTLPQSPSDSHTDPGRLTEEANVESHNMDANGVMTNETEKYGNSPNHSQATEKTPGGNSDVKIGQETESSSVSGNKNGQELTENIPTTEVSKHNTSMQAEVSTSHTNNDEEKSSPKIVVQAGPIFVEDAAPDVPLIEAILAEEPMDANTPQEAEVVVRPPPEETIEIAPAVERSQDANESETGNNPIVFPETAHQLPAEPDPTPLADNDGQEHHMQGSSMNNSAGANDTQVGIITPYNKSVDGTQKSSENKPIIFPRSDIIFDSEDESDENAPKIQEMTTDMSISGTAEGVFNNMQNDNGEENAEEHTTSGPHLTGTETDLDASGQPNRPDLNDKREKSELDNLEDQIITKEKSDMNGVETQSDIDVNGNTPENTNVQNKPQMGDMETKPEMDNMQAKPEKGNIESGSSEDDMDTKPNVIDTVSKPDKDTESKKENKPQMNDMEITPDTSDTEKTKLAMDDTETKSNMEEKEDEDNMENKASMDDKEDKPDVDDMEVKSDEEDTTETDKSEINSKPEMSEANGHSESDITKENLEKEDQIKEQDMSAMADIKGTEMDVTDPMEKEKEPTSEARQESDVTTEAQNSANTETEETQDDEASSNSPSQEQGSRELEEKSVSNSKSQGKHVLLEQILKNLFG